MAVQRDVVLTLHRLPRPTCVCVCRGWEIPQEAGGAGCGPAPDAEHAKCALQSLTPCPKQLAKGAGEGGAGMGANLFFLVPFKTRPILSAAFLPPALPLAG